MDARQTAGSPVALAPGAVHVGVSPAASMPPSAAVHVAGSPSASVGACGAGTPSPPAGMPAPPAAPPPPPSRLFESRKRRRHSDNPIGSDKPDRPSKENITNVAQAKPSIVHSMIRTMRVSCQGDTPCTQLDEEVAIPPLQLLSTGQHFLGAALLSGICIYALGTPTISAWLPQITPAFGGVFWSFASDSAAPNVVMLAQLTAYLLLSAVAANTICFVWWEPCGLHQLARVTVSILGIHGIAASMYSASRALRLGRNARSFDRALKQFVLDSMEWKFGEVPPKTSPRYLPASL